MAGGDGTTFEKQVLEASERLSDIAELTPLQRNPRLSAATGAEVWFKREDLQVGRSYKLRGAYNLISQLDDDARAAGVVCASAGNHAQGFAFACAAHGVRGRVVIPSTTPRQKRERIAALGGDMIDLVVEGDTYDEASAAASGWSTDTGATLVPAFDDTRTVAGQATVIAEIVEQLGRTPTPWSSRSAAAVCSPARRPGCRPPTPAPAWSASSRPAPATWPPPCTPAPRWCSTSTDSTGSSTAPPCARPAR